RRRLDAQLQGDCALRHAGRGRVLPQRRHLAERDAQTDLDLIAMDLLVLGGTVFLGRSVVRAALERGDRVTIFHRGRHAIDEDLRSAGAGELDELIGDRRGDLAALAGRRWDAVIDTSGYVPSEVERAARALGANVGRYVFVSSISVYADFTNAG